MDPNCYSCCLGDCIVSYYYHLFEEVGKLQASVKQLCELTLAICNRVPKCTPWGPTQAAVKMIQQKNPKKLLKENRQI